MKAHCARLSMDCSKSRHKRGANIWMEFSVKTKASDGAILFMEPLKGNENTSTTLLRVLFIKNRQHQKRIKRAFKL